MDYKNALDLARAWIRAFEDRLEVDEASTITRPYGWIFLFRPAPGYGELVGAPSSILVHRIFGEVRLCGVPLEVYLLHYEAALSPGQLALAPEMPTNVTINHGFFGVIDPHKPVDVGTFPEFLKWYVKPRGPRSPLRTTPPLWVMRLLGRR